jgi:hypothetical protein
MWQEKASLPIEASNRTPELATQHVFGETKLGLDLTKPYIATFFPDHVANFDSPKQR